MARTRGGADGPVETRDEPGRRRTSAGPGLFGFEAMSTRASVIVSLLLASMLFWTSSRAQPARGSPVDEGQIPVLRAQSDLVVLHVAVQDRASRFVPGLTARQFKIYEDGAPQTIRFFSREDSPATIGLVVDNSGSMRAKRRDVIAGSLAFIRASNPDNELFITNFNEAVWPSLPPSVPFTSDRTVLTSALSATRARGQTALYDAVSQALEHLTLGANSRQVLVVISDGSDNASVARLDQVLQRAQEAHAVIYTLGLFDESSFDRNPRVLKQLAAVTGGERFLPDNVREASNVLERVARDIRNAYDIGYESTNPKRDGKFRRIQVTVDSGTGERFSVRTRTGYIVPAEGTSPR